MSFLGLGDIFGGLNPLNLVKDITSAVKDFESGNIAAGFGDLLKTATDVTSVVDPELAPILQEATAAESALTKVT